MQRHGHGERAAIRRGLREIAQLIESGALVAAVGPVFPPTEASRAQALRETGYGRGRVVLKRAELAHPGAVAACVTRDLE